MLELMVHPAIWIVAGFMTLTGYILHMRAQVRDLNRRLFIADQHIQALYGRTDQLRNRIHRSQTGVERKANQPS